MSFSNGAASWGAQDHSNSSQCHGDKSMRHAFSPWFIYFLHKQTPWTKQYVFTTYQSLMTRNYCMSLSKLFIVVFVYWCCKFYCTHKFHIEVHDHYKLNIIPTTSIVVPTKKKNIYSLYYIIIHHKNKNMMWWWYYMMRQEMNEMMILLLSHHH